MGPRSKPYTPEPLVALASLPALCTAAILIAAPRLDPEPLSGLIIGSSLLFLLPAVLLVPLRHAWPPLILTAEEGDRVLFTRIFWRHLVRAFTIGTVAAPLIMLLVGLLGRPAGLGGATRVALANYLMAASWALPFLAATGVILAACGALGARRAARVALIIAALATVATMALVSRLDISPLYLSFAAGTAAPCFAVVFALATTRAVLATGHLSYRPFQTASDAEHPTGSAPRGPIIWPSIATGVALAILVALASRRGETAVIAAGTILGPYFALAMLLGGLGLRRAASAAGQFDRRYVMGLYAVLGTTSVLLLLLSGSLTAVLFPTLEDDGRRVIAIALRLSALLILMEPLAAGVTGLPAGRAQRAITTSCLWLITLPAAGAMLLYLQLNAVAVVLALIAARVVAVLLGLLGAALARRADTGTDPTATSGDEGDGMPDPEPARPTGPTRSRGQSRDQNRVQNRGQTGAPHTPTTSLR